MQFPLNLMCYNLIYSPTMRLVRPFEILFLLGAVLAGVAVSIWLAIWSPDALLRDPLPLYRQGAATSSPEITGDRTVRAIRLVGPDGETISFRVSQPTKLPLNPLPVLVVVTGFPGAPDPIQHITHPGQNVIVSYHPPFDPEMRLETLSLFNLWQTRRVIYRMPEEVSALLAWIGRQEWADRKRINLAGYGLGAAILPAIRRRAAATGQPVKASIFINGGADIEALASADLGGGMAWLAGQVLRPLNPATHLPEISGPFLVINTDNDTAIPVTTRSALETLLPEPMTIANVMRGTDSREDYIARIIRVGQNWLVAQSALTP
ncbi:MAG: hypothetical protein WD767_01540 [Alphaproteobacteria bacterium]